MSNQIIYDIELHDTEGIRSYFQKNGDPNELIPGLKPLFTFFLEMYTRTPRFHQCVKEFINAGLKFDIPLLAVLTDDAVKLEGLVKENKSLLTNTYTLFNAAYTALAGATLLHFCAEYNSVDCGAVLIRSGADINARAAIDGDGFGGHTPIFHTVNQNMNNSAGMLQLLLDNGADVTYTVKGIIWGAGHEWETFIPAVNAVSYAMMGLLPQMHREETTVSKIIKLLIKHAYGINYDVPNIPNAYLERG